MQRNQVGGCSTAGQPWQLPRNAAYFPNFVCKVSDITKQCRQLDMNDCRLEKLRRAVSSESSCHPAAPGLPVGCCFLGVTFSRCQMVSVGQTFSMSISCDRSSLFTFSIFSITEWPKGTFGLLPSNTYTVHYGSTLLYLCFGAVCNASSSPGPRSRYFAWFNLPMCRSNLSRQRGLFRRRLKVWNLSSESSHYRLIQFQFKCSFRELIQHLTRFPMKTLVAYSDPKHFLRWSLRMS